MIAVLVLAAAALATYESEWAKFKQAYGKKYDETEEGKRFAIFKDNMRYISLLNKLDKTATYGVNKFSDLSQEEFASKYLGHIGLDDTDIPEGTIGDVSAPASWDWVAQGKVNPVQDQGSCGGCWSFATTATFETAYAIHTGQLIKLSEQLPIDCDMSQAGCNGGNHTTSPSFYVSNGSVAENLYPYAGVSQSCMDNAAWTHYKAAGFKQVPNQSSYAEKEVTMLDYLYQYGLLLIGINATPVQFYTGGVLNPSSCSTASNHAVTIAGYGTDNGIDYWKIRNSWGASWGEAGYFRIIRGENKCGISTSPVYFTF